MNATTQNGSDAVIQVNPNETVTLQDQSVADLKQSNFTFA